jgi:hypothetical protein
MLATVQPVRLNGDTLYHARAVFYQFVMVLEEVVKSGKMMHKATKRLQESKSYQQAFRVQACK